MNKIFGYIYHTFCAASGKHYVGQKTGAKFDPFYFGSGIALRRAILKYGEDAFTVTPIKWVESKAELDIQEIWFIAAYRKQYGRARMYNIADGGKGGAGHRGHHHSEENKLFFKKLATGRRHSEKTKNKISTILRSMDKKKFSPWLGKKMSAEQCRNISLSKIGKRPTLETRLKLSAWQKGKPKSAEHRLKISLANMGHHHSQETRDKIRKSTSGALGHNFGKKLSEDTKKKISESQKLRYMKSEMEVA